MRLNQTDWFSLAYLRAGNPRQQAAARALAEAQVLEALAEYDPVLTGTIPLGIDLPASDLDVICAASDLAAFEQTARQAFSRHAGFELKHKIHQDLAACVVNFWAGGFEIQLFAQPRPVRQQNAFRHMLVEARLLDLGGAAARQAVLAQRQRGLKTEPAFGAVFHLPGDPYLALLELSDLSEAELRQAVANFAQAASFNPAV